MPPALARAFSGFALARDESGIGFNCPLNSATITEHANVK